MATPLFILGAGFSLAANLRYGSTDSRFAKRYPLAKDLGPECFGQSWDSSKDIEAAFDDALRARKRQPIARLVKLIQTADYYLGWAEARDQASIYGRLIERFRGAHFLSFNYDSLLEQVLLHRGMWSPVDGFGVPVEIGTGHPRRRSQPTTDISSAVVLHLHGSVLLYPVEFSWDRREASDHILLMNRMKQPKFRFDPDNLGDCFSPFNRAQPTLGYRDPGQRVIVPVPDKSERLLESYVQVVYRRAVELLSAADQVIAVGYRFAECDRASFEPLLKVVVQQRSPLWIVAPDAPAVSMALRQRYRGLKIRAVPTTLEGWAESGFSDLEYVG